MGRRCEALDQYGRGQMDWLAGQLSPEESKRLDELKALAAGCSTGRVFTDVVLLGMGGVEPRSRGCSRKTFGIQKDGPRLSVLDFHRSGAGADRRKQRSTRRNTLFHRGRASREARSKPNRAEGLLLRPASKRLSVADAAGSHFPGHHRSPGSRP